MLFQGQLPVGEILQQSPAEGGSFALASNTIFQVPSGCRRQMLM